MASASRPSAPLADQPMRQPQVALSKETLRSLLRQIEQEVSQSEVYQLAAAQWQASIDLEVNPASLKRDQADPNPEQLLKSVSREAIRLSLRQFAKQYNLAIRQSEFAAHGSATQNRAAKNGMTDPASAGVGHLPDPLKAIGSAQANLGGLSPAAPPGTSLDTDTYTLPDQSAVETTVQSSMPIADSDRDKTAAEQMPVAEVASLASAAASPSKAQGRSRGKTRLTRQQIERARRQQEWQQAVVKIGQIIQQRRVACSIRVEQLHNQSLVPIYQIRALETGDLEALPEAVYVRGFIQRICEALELDSQALLSTLPAADPNEGITPSWKPSRKPLRFGALTATHLYLGYAALVVGSVSGLNWLSSQGESATPVSIWDETSADPAEKLTDSPRSRPTAAQVPIQAVALPEAINSDR